ncbi:MAG: 14.7 kDa ribonuclease H-like protein [Planctomycetes bacterium ADurb.Bin126]|nr:MAG: 14.7 kDa ribonuclease H-like protein [Planctomycetes bacterium ADurb.Bin126]
MARKPNIRPPQGTPLLDPPASQAARAPSDPPAGARKVVVHVDGGSRGNPGPAGAGIVVSADDGTVLIERGIFIGHATNNVAEYRGLIGGLESAALLGASEVEIVSDSELMVRQMTGQYRVKNAGLQPLYDKACQLARQFARCRFRHVRREQNVQADKLANLAMNRRCEVHSAE